MSKTDLNAFLKALDAVKSDYTCGVCSELCKDPVALSKCFHLICSEHFVGLKFCPTCKVSLEGCTTFVNPRLQSIVDSAKEIGNLMGKIRGNDVITIATTDSSPPVDIAVLKSKFRAVSKIDKGRSVVLDKQEKKPPASKATKKAKNRDENESPNTHQNLSILSNASSKVLEKRNNKGETHLHVACRVGKIDRVTDLLNQGANTNTKDNAGWTPLHEAVQSGNLALVQLLLKYNTLINVPGQSNETPLHEAVRYNFDTIAEELVKNGADISAKNCKGETPLQLASPEMKQLLDNAAENVLNTQTVNISHISSLHCNYDANTEIWVYCTSQHRTVSNKLKSLTKQFSNIHLELDLTPKVTHLIVDTDDDLICLPTLSVLQGIVKSIWILSSQWAMKSTTEKLASFEDYEVKGVGTKMYNGPQNARYNKYKQLPGIFNGCHIYLHNFNTKYEISKSIVVTKAFLTKLITDGGGVVLKRAPNPEAIPDAEKLIPYHAKRGGKMEFCSHYIIFKDGYEPMYNMQHLKALPVGWLIECIEKYEFLEPF